MGVAVRGRPVGGRERARWVVDDEQAVEGAGGGGHPDQPVSHPDRPRPAPGRVEKTVTLRTGRPLGRAVATRPDQDAPEGVLHGHGQAEVLVEDLGKSLLREIGDEGLAEPRLEAVVAGEDRLDLGRGSSGVHGLRSPRGSIAVHRIAPMTLRGPHEANGVA
ncbi:hypothetical protein Acsp07_52380 [Actinomycetospora sp. NBRC 106378]|nr:hypothetical protein Acsp07_52380 [Actinomycetospora sp. NBRC 106378]